ncbi:MAG: PQQ-binding-like beta-propeller repeat protein [Geminicoccaceae bacterium]|nr:PQQ-binding-like beta-propeller repeat protein [Geminicoccaceae bacterium]
MVRAPLALGLLFGLAGCSGGWLGTAEEGERLPGERIPVMLLERELTADPELTGLEVRLPPPIVNAAWPQAGGRAGHAMQHLAAGDRLDRAWQADVGESSGGSGQLLARPVVEGGRVFTMDAEGTVTALEVRGGREIWQLTPDDLDPDDAIIGGGLAVSDLGLFVTVSSGTVLALDPASGAELWRQDLGLPLRAAPTVADGRVLVLSADNQLYALDATSGRPVWRHSGFFESAGILGGPSPAVSGDIVIVPYSSAEVYALRLDTGRPIWNDTIQRPRRTLALAEINDIDGHPVIDDDVVFIAGHGGQMAALDLRRGIRAWDIDLASTETPWLAGDYLYVLTTRGEVVCLLRQNGRVRWVSPLPRLEDPEDPASIPIGWSGPILVGDRLLIAGSDGQMIAMSPYNGEILGRIELDGPVQVAPIAADGTVFVLTEDALLLAYR